MNSSDHHGSIGGRGRRLLVGLVAGTAAAACLATPALAHGDAEKPAEKLLRALDGVVDAGAPGAAVLVRRGDRTMRLASGQS